jgi:BirA family biotin operon repressor/biotin-[acetyl-CoA-carboxylase] ligase
MNFDIQIIDSVGSTMDVLSSKLQSEDKKAEEGLAVQAYEQVSGKGRHGNSWISPKGNLYISVLFFPQKDIKDFGQMAFVVALALKQTYLYFNINKDDLRLKWPNDILIHNKKAAGLLLEAGKDIDNRDYLILGAGVNIFYAPEEKFKLTDFRTDFIQGDEVTIINEFRDIFLKNLSQYYTIWHKKDFTFIKDEWLESAAFLNEEINVRSANDVRKGVFETIDDNGALLLRGKDGKTTRVLSGEVFF